jgi:hypothetical protein
MTKVLQINKIKYQTCNFAYLLTTFKEKYQNQQPYFFFYRKYPVSFFGKEY